MLGLGGSEKIRAMEDVELVAIGKYATKGLHGLLSSFILKHIRFARKLLAGSTCRH
jgi:hypothetical protein